MSIKVTFGELEIGRCFRHLGETYQKVKEDWGQLVDADSTEDTAIIQVFEKNVVVELDQSTITDPPNGD